MIKRITKIPGSIVKFFKEVLQEMKLVDFPKRKETINKTITVLSISVGLGLFLFSLDSIFIALRNLLTNLTF